MESTGTWLCPTEQDRARALEAGERLRVARLVVVATIGAALVVAAPWVNVWTLPLLAICALEIFTLDRRVRRAKKPEWLLARAQLVVLLVLAVGVALDDGPYGVSLPWLVIPVVVAATRFRRQVVAVAGAIAVLAMILVTVPFDPQAVVDDPTPLLASIVLLVAVTAIVLALASGELEHRRTAVLDSLTGLLNRAALARRVEELEEQAHLTGAGVALVLCDLDRFKRVNDTHGHERGDAVLRDVAYEIRKSLRSFELVYRIGGEEFLVLLPGMSCDGAMEIAQRIRRAVANARPGDVELTLSAGVACVAGERMRYEDLFRAADAALLEAKRQGRDRVVQAGELPEMPYFDARSLESGAAAVS